jgi:hypothetical protein
MRLLIALLFTLASASVPNAASAQAVADTLPERVVSQAYDAFNRHDPAAFFSFFAPVWYYTAMADTTAGARQHIREDDIREYTELGAFRSKPTIKVIRRLVVGPYVVDEQARGRDGTVHLDIFEVRGGKIVHEWEGGPTGTAP